MLYKLIIIDETHPLCGKTVMGDLRYYGGGMNLYFGKTKDGEIELVSSQINEEYYWEQRGKKAIEKLGAKVGDRVEIIRTGSGHFKQGWTEAGLHTITKIDPVGHVEFDNGEADFFRPIVKPVYS